jgi:hypothetical protein
MEVRLLLVKNDEDEYVSAVFSRSGFVFKSRIFTGPSHDFGWIEAQISLDKEGDKCPVNRKGLCCLRMRRINT